MRQGEECFIVVSYDGPFRFSFEAGFDADAFVDDCPGHLTGADFYAISSDAMLNAMKRQIGRIDEARGKST